MKSIAYAIVFAASAHCLVFGDAAPEPAGFLGVVALVSWFALFAREEK